MKEIKEMAEELRKLVRRTDMVIAETQEGHPPMLSVSPREVLALADKYDPPRPKEGVPLWYRQIDTTDFFHGVATQDGEGVFGPYGRYVWSEIEWKPARIAGPMQEIVDIPPVSGWRDETIAIVIADGRYTYFMRTITRAEAERRETNGKVGGSHDA